MIESLRDPAACSQALPICARSIIPRNAGGCFGNEGSGSMHSNDFSIYAPLYASRSSEAHKEGARKHPGEGGLQTEQERTKSAAPGFALFPLSGGRWGVDPFWRGLSPWTRSTAKRVFDCVCVLLALPVALPLSLAIGAAVGLTSRGPILFLQERAGMSGRNFTILKFRTMVHAPHKTRQAVTTLQNQEFTSIGPFLRRWKLDELPQLANVLLGHMSMVGPRPKMPDHVLRILLCRPGVTSGATIAFANEAEILGGVPGGLLDDYYRKVILPAKRQMDAEYLSQATFFSDLGLLIDTVLRRWNMAAARAFIAAAEYEACQQRFPVEHAGIIFSRSGDVDVNFSNGEPCGRDRPSLGRITPAGKVLAV